MVRRLLPLLLFALVIACSAPARGSEPGAAAVATAAAPEEMPAASAVATPPATATAPPLPAVEVQPDGQNAYRHVQVLAGDIGPRVAGSEAGRAAADYIAARLREYGYDVELQQFPIQLWVSRSVSFHVLTPREETLRAAAMQNSLPGAAAGELVFAGLGRAADYPVGGIGGRIALVQRGELTFAEKARNAAAAGAAAVVIFDPQNSAGFGTLLGDVPAIPVLTIDGGDGARLREALRDGAVTVSLAFDGGAGAATGVNVVARPPGKGCAAVVGGHFDTVPGAPGASDNASGTATVLEVARVQAARGNPEQACFIAFDAEELGLVGSRFFVDALSEGERNAIRVMINLDMVAVGDAWKLIGSRALLPRGRQIAAALGIAADPADLVGASSDHASFLDRRIPAIMLHRWDDPLLHTPRDTVDRIAPEPLETAARLTLAFLTALPQG
jgi:aminopeptidase YwaD